MPKQFAKETITIAAHLGEHGAPGIAVMMVTHVEDMMFITKSLNMIQLGQIVYMVLSHAMMDAII